MSDLNDVKMVQLEAHLDVRADLYKQPWEGIEPFVKFGSIVGVGLLPDDPPWVAVLIRTHEGVLVMAGTTVKLAMDAIRHLGSVLETEEP